MVRLRREESRDGLVTVEMALLLPLLLILTLGLIEYGWMFLKAQQITNASRQAARIGAVPDATDGDVQAEVDRIMIDAGLAGSGYTVTVDPGSVVGLAPGTTVTVTVTLPYGDVRLLGIPLIPVPAQLTSHTSMAKEGP